MKVARVTVRATTHGLMMGRDFGLGVELSFGLAGGATAGAVETGGSKTAWLAKFDRPFLLPQEADGSDGAARGFIYDDRPLCSIRCFERTVRFRYFLF
jgi:hypothetical protein